MKRKYFRSFRFQAAPVSPAQAASNGAEVRAEGGAPVIEGYAAVFNSVEDFGYWTESIATGAFKDAIARGDDVRALFNHNPDMVLGRYPKTLSLKEDEKGLFMRIQVPDTQLGRDLVTLIERGDVTQASFGFFIDEEKIDRTGEKTHFTIEKVSLFDVSPVTYPAYTATQVQVKRDDESLLEEFRDRIASALAAEAQKAAREREIQLLKLSA